MLGSIKYNLANLTNFSGRDARQTFWYYVLFLVIINFVAGIIISLPMSGAMMSQGFGALQEGANEQQMQMAMLEEMSGYLWFQLVMGVIVSIVTACLFMASFVRRLHDSGKAGWIAIIVLALFMTSATVSLGSYDKLVEVSQMQAQDVDPGKVIAAQGNLMIYSLPGWISYLLVIVFGVMKSDDGPNKYGEEPVRF